MQIHKIEKARAIVQAIMLRKNGGFAGDISTSLLFPQTVVFLAELSPAKPESSNNISAKLTQLRIEMKPSTVIGLVLMVPAMLGYLYYGWLLYQTVTSETNPWIETLFATTFIFWLLPLIGLIFFAVMFWRQKDHEEDKARASG